MLLSLQKCTTKLQRGASPRPVELRAIILLKDIVVNPKYKAEHTKEELSKLAHKISFSRNGARGAFQGLFFIYQNASN